MSALLCELDSYATPGEAMDYPSKVIDVRGESVHAVGHHLAPRRNRYF